METAKGYDISKWQAGLNPADLKTAGANFVIIKAGGSDSGCYRDSWYETFYALAKACGLGVGAYYYVGPNFTTAKDGKADAKRFKTILAGKQFEYPVYLDIEDFTAGAAPAAYTEAAAAFCDTMEKAGYYVGIYSSELSGFKNHLNAADLSAYDFWIANWTKSPAGLAFGMWQYSSRQKVPGYNFYIDGDYAYKNYPDIMIRNKLNGFTE